MTPRTDLIPPQVAQTIPALFQERVKRSSNQTGYKYYNKIEKNWYDISWNEMSERVDLWRSALQQENFSPGDRVAMMLPNCPEWVSFDLAALSLGLITVPLYINDRPDNVAYILNDTEAKLFLCPGKTCWESLGDLLETVKSIQRIVTINFCEHRTEDNKVMCISDWLPVSPLEKQIYTPKPEDTATIVYTSGTTGMPKGVMLSHKNILVNAYASSQCITPFQEDLFLSFLPLSHMLERTGGYYLPMMAGSTVAFARSIPELSEDLVNIRPTILVAVPRIFERVYGAVRENLEQKPALAQKLFSAAVYTGWKEFEYRQKRSAWSPAILFQPLLDKIIGEKIRAKLGGRLRVIISGGAPLSAEIAKVFISLGLPIYQGYGLTETSPVISVNRIENNEPSGVGLPLPGTETRIDDSGELLVRGDFVMQGYWNKPEATQETIDPDGWLHTGDIGEIINGHLRITGRLKEVIVLSNGQKVSPADIEMAISMDPLFEQSMVIGEGRPYLILLAVLEKNRWSALAEKLGVPQSEESLKTDIVQQEVQERIEELMKSFPGYAFIKKTILTLEPWTIEHGLLTPTMKIKRNKVENRLEREIDAAYSV